MQSCWWRERFSQTTATAFCPTIHQGVRGCMPTRHDDKYACQPSTVRFWQLGISTAQINFQSQTLRKDLKFTAPDSQEALIFTGGRQKKKSSRQAQFVILQRSKQFFPSRIFLSKCCDPLKSSIGQKVSTWKLEKKKVCGLLLHKEWLLQSSWIQCIVWRFRTKYVQRKNEKAVGRVQSRQIQDFTENVSNSPLLVFFIVLQTRH